MGGRGGWETEKEKSESGEKLGYLCKVTKTVVPFLGWGVFKVLIKSFFIILFIPYLFSMAQTGLHDCANAVRIVSFKLFENTLNEICVFSNTPDKSNTDRSFPLVISPFQTFSFVTLNFFSY